MRVQLEHCWKWVCRKCQATNYADMVPAELTPDERFEASDALGIPSDTSGAFMTHPSHVTCLECFEEFEAQIPEEPEDADEE